MARVLALVAAVIMVVGSLAVRSRLDEAGGGGDGGGDGDRGDVRLLCSSELAPVCEALEGRAEVSVEPAALTADRLAKDGPQGPASLDGWLVPSSWPEMVQAARRRSGLEPLLETGPVLARSPLVLAVWPDRLGLLRQGCPPPGDVTWRCWGDAAGQGRVKPGHAGVDEAVGVATVGAATAGFFGQPDFSRNDIEANDEYRSWLARLERSVRSFRPVAGSALKDMLLKGPVEFDAVATTEAEAGPLVAVAAVKPTVIYPSPVATVDVVLATVPGGRSKRLSRAVEGDGLDALARSGWRVPDHRLAAGVPPQPELPATNGLPDPGVLDFLRTLSKEVAR